MKKNVGCHVQLVPPACLIDEMGRESTTIDDFWTVDKIADSEVHISNNRSGHTTTLGKDHVHHFTTNPDLSKTGTPHGFFTLNVQIFIQGEKVSIRPNARPGDPVMLQQTKVVEKLVVINYPGASGIQKKLEADGFRVSWCLETKQSQKVDLEGWEVVIEPDRQGRLTKFRLKDRPVDQIWGCPLG